MGKHSEERLNIVLDIGEGSRKTSGPGQDQQLHSREFVDLLESRAQCLARTATHAVSFYRALAEFGGRERSNVHGIAIDFCCRLTRVTVLVTNHHQLPLPQLPLPLKALADFSATETIEFHGTRVRKAIEEGKATKAIDDPQFLYLHQLLQLLSLDSYPPRMTQLSTDQVRHIAKLARLELSDAEVEKFSRELTSILTYVEQLQNVDTKNVEPTAQVTGQKNSLRDDVVADPLASPDALLATSPLPIEEHQIETLSAHD